MKLKMSQVVLAVVGVVSFATGVAVAQDEDIMMQRYFDTEANIQKGTALLNAITTKNSAEKKQRDKALSSLATALKAVNCAEARRLDAGAACP